MSAMPSQVTWVSIVYSTVCWGATGLCGGIQRWPVNSPHKGPVTQKMFPFDDVIIVEPVPGGRLNKKDGLSRYGNSHVKDKTS